MTMQRRTFFATGLSSSALAGFGLAALAGRRLDARTDDRSADDRAARPLDVLVLGGTGFLGPAVVDALLARGHRVTLFNRGRTRAELYPDLEKLRGDRDPDRDGGLAALEGDRRWDAVIDNSGYYPRHVGASARLLADRVGIYLFVSSISAFKEAAPPGSDESWPSATLADPTVESMGERFENYGGLKAACEAAAEAAMPGRVANVRPGYIVGPGDPTGRFTYWPIRAREGGRMLAPGAPEDPIQWIDVRDLARWMVRCVEERIVGVMLATGPARPASIGEIIQTCIATARAVAQDPATIDTTPVWVPADFLQTQGIGPGPMPIWIPPVGEYAGFHRWNNALAVRNGLAFRPLGDTVAAIYRWFDAQPAERQPRLRGGIPREREQAVLEAWDGAERSGSGG